MPQDPRVLPGWTLKVVGIAFTVITGAAVPWAWTVSSSLKELQVRMEHASGLMASIPKIEDRLSAHIADPDLHHAGFAKAETRFQALERRIEILERHIERLNERLIELSAKKAAQSTDAQASSSILRTKSSGSSDSAAAVRSISARSASLSSRNRPSPSRRRIVFADGSRTCSSRAPAGNAFASSPVKNGWDAAMISRESFSTITAAYVGRSSIPNTSSRVSSGVMVRTLITHLLRAGWRMQNPDPQGSFADRANRTRHEKKALPSARGTHLNPRGTGFQLFEMSWTQCHPSPLCLNVTPTSNC